MRFYFGFLVFFLATTSPASSQGVFSDSVAFQGQSGYYSLYVPETYDSLKGSALLVLFDPGGRASVPVGLYRSIADKYSLVIASSYESRNGSFDVARRAYEKLIAELTRRFRLSSIKILGGFSGGARAATLFALDAPGVGVIACGATFPPHVPVQLDRFTRYSVVVGNRDMNYLEGFQTYEELSRNKHPSVRFLPFNGGHEWPPVEVFDNALQWHLSALDSPDLFHREGARIRSLSSAREYLQAERIFLSMPQSFQEVYRDSLERMIPRTALNSQRQRESKLLQEESRWQQDFLDRVQQAMRFVHTDSAFDERSWRVYAAGIERMRASDDSARQLLGERVFDFSWRFCAGRGSQFIVDNNFRSALLLMEIWSTVHRSDYRPMIASARIYGILKEDKKVLVYLRKAVSRGFRNTAYLLQEPAFEGVRSSKPFKKIVEGMR